MSTLGAKNIDVITLFVKDLDRSLNCVLVIWEGINS